MKLWDALLNLVFPVKCPFCGRVEDLPGICPACEAALSRTEGGDALLELDGGLLCAAPLWYKDTVRAGLLRLKFQGAAAVADILGELIAQCAAEQFPGMFDVVTWAPVSGRRLRKRGYDQAQLLAESACRAWATRPERLLRKVRDNPAQSGLESAGDRRKNVQGVYAAMGSPAGKRILLIDDICTTGSTLRACAEVLMEAGAASVLCAAAARTPRDVKPGG